MITSHDNAFRNVSLIWFATKHFLEQMHVQEALSLGMNSFYLNFHF